MKDYSKPLKGIVTTINVPADFSTIQAGIDASGNSITYANKEIAFDFIEKMSVGNI